MSFARWGVLVGGLAVAMLLAAFGGALQRTSGRLTPGSQAPPFDVITFDGERVTSAELRGQVVVLNFWASWCEECEDEARDLESIWREYRDSNVVVLGIDYTDTEKAALEYLDRFDITYPNAPDSAGRVSTAYRLTGVPETVVIDQAGRLTPLVLRGVGAPVAKIVGPIVASGPFAPDDLRRTLDELVASGP